ncbi:pyruvate decarboxylase [Leptodontidium sp. 2 PMI_412]|nr:pyruvate decarboxylase [Leptodontidium sp. 2 PMI_412]
MTEFQQPVSIASYLWTRLRQLNIKSVHGVPGDYNLNLLDNISSAGLQWVGSCNELNGGYAADGYARVNGIGAMVTTGGVGELSAINAHAGAYAEQVSLVHIVGSPALRIRSNRKFCMHHSLGNHEYNTFKDMFKPISAAQVSLDDVSNAPELIDHALRTCWMASRPVYIEIPSDMAKLEIEGARLTTVLDLSSPANDPVVEQQALSLLHNRLSEAMRPCFLIDMCAARQRAGSELHQLTRRLGIPAFVTPLAQGFVDESLPNFGGLFAGKGSHVGVQDFVEGSDLVLHIGPLDTDVTTYLGSANLKPSSLIRIFPDQVVLIDAHFTSLYMKGLVQTMLGQLDTWKVSVVPFQRPMKQNGAIAEDETAISQKWLWPYIGTWLEPEDIVLTDTGTASFGIFDTPLPYGNMLINISLWASIGYSLPSAQGAALAVKDSGSGRRTIVFQGDGSFQLTCQEISTMIKHRLQVIIFVICNNGYTIERAVHETTERYNDVLNWNYREILRVFDLESDFSRSYSVRSQAEMTKLLLGRDFSTYQGVQLVELHIPEMDVPLPLQNLSDLIAGR